MTRLPMNDGKFKAALKRARGAHTKRVREPLIPPPKRPGVKLKPKEKP